jgi:ABC-type branched-subunit amino acid transport system permease subunit
MQKTPTSFKELVEFVIGFINILIPALFGVLFLYIIWKIIDAWILHADDDSKREEGRRLVITAVLVFVLMISTWGIVAMIKQSLF